MENPIKMDDLGVPLFLETPMLSLVFFGDLCQLNFEKPQNEQVKTQYCTLKHKTLKVIRPTYVQYC